jgi:hypothetical protein
MRHETKGIYREQSTEGEKEGRGRYLGEFVGSMAT